MISRCEFNQRGATAVAGMALAQAVTSGAEAQMTNGPVPAAAPRTMRAAQTAAFRSALRVAQVPVMAPRRDGAVVRVEASGVCRSDWRFWNQDWTWVGVNVPLPAVMGHEVGGVVVEVGRDVRAVKVGDRVTIPFHEADGTCPQCRAGF